MAACRIVTKWWAPSDEPILTPAEALRPVRVPGPKFPLAVESFMPMSYWMANRSAVSSARERTPSVGTRGKELRWE